MSMIERTRQRMLDAILEPFSHGSNPLDGTLQHAGDPGIFGPDSATWPIMGDVAALFGGIRALLIQFAHPEVAAGMVDHSSYERDPLGRISRTTDYVAATSFGAMPEVERAIATVQRAHRRVKGTSDRGIDYDANARDLTSWVHNSLSESFLVAFQAFGPRPVHPDEADRYAVEQQRLGAMIGADEVPGSAVQLSEWIAEYPAVRGSKGAQSVVPFIARPEPAGTLMAMGYKPLYWAACATLPPRIRAALGVRRYPGALWGGRMLARLLRWTMGSSPAWLAALTRTGSPRPVGVTFRQPVPGRQTTS